MQQNNITIPCASIDDTNNQPKNIHELFSCEKLKELADQHRELCMGIYASIIGGASVTDIGPLVDRLIEQAEDISARLNLSLSLSDDLLQKQLVVRQD